MAVKVNLLLIMIVLGIASFAMGIETKEPVWYTICTAFCACYWLIKDLLGM